MHEGTWTLADCPPETQAELARTLGISEVTAAVARGRIYVAGGFLEDASNTSLVEVYDTASNKWSTGPPLPLALNHAMASALDDVRSWASTQAPCTWLLLYSA